MRLPTSANLARFRTPVPKRPRTRTWLMAHSSPEHAEALKPLLSRGVFLACFLSARGRPVLLAVDSKGRERHRKEVGPETSVQEVVRKLQGLLDLLDPSGRIH